MKTISYKFKTSVDRDTTHKLVSPLLSSIEKQYPPSPTTTYHLTKEGNNLIVCVFGAGKARVSLIRAFNNACAKRGTLVVS